MKKNAFLTFLALPIFTFCEAVPSIAQTTAPSRTTESTHWLLESEFKNLGERDRIRIQSHLAEYGLYDSTLDGLWGRNTEGALRQAAAMMEQNMGTELALHSPVRARAFLRQFIDGSADAFMWGEGGECDGCGEADLQPATVVAPEDDCPDCTDPSEDAGNTQHLQQAIFASCLKNARLLNHYVSTDPVASNAFNTKVSTSVKWAELGLSVKRLGVRHVGNRWQAVDDATLVEACKEQERWADLFGSEIQYLGKRILLRDLAFRDSQSGELSQDLTLHEKHSVAVYPLTDRETERLNRNSGGYNIMGASFHLIESTACLGSSSVSKVREKRSASGTKVRVVGANRSTTPITACEEVQDVIVEGQPYDLSEQSQCFVNFHFAPNTYNVAEEPIDDDALRAFSGMGGYAMYSQPFGLHLVEVLSHSDFQNWQHHGAWFLNVEGDVRDVAKVLGAATDAFEGNIDWGTAQQQLNVTAQTYVTQPASGREDSSVVTHPLCQSALTETRNEIASHRLNQ
ncbi:hypothetical protein PNH50_15795 [Leisingera aquaemixtae]|uniref:hypothetical protein n=1 Tax=Leisingera aquaemixtae TaxID=1396826 RepID=UPI003983E483